MTRALPRIQPPISQGEIHEHRWRILGVQCLSLVLIVAGNSSLNVALPTIVRELGATQTQLQWIVDAYAITFAAILLPAGALGDRYGRKGTLQVGLTVFGGAAFGRRRAGGRRRHRGPRARPAAGGGGACRVVTGFRTAFVVATVVALGAAAMVARFGPHDVTDGDTGP